MELRVETAREADLADVAEVLAEAFHDDPFMSRLLPGAGRRDRMRRFFDASVRTLGAEHETIDIVRDGDRILAAAVWTPPGHHRRLSRLVLRTPSILAAMGPRGLAAAVAWGLRVARRRHRHGSKEPRWYLADIGVGAAARGRGAGGALLAHRLAIIDAAGQRAALTSTTPRSARLYARWGFEPTSVTTAFEHVTLTSMVRPRRQRGDVSREGGGGRTP
ncbi:GNAT family N-acetyltransferase [Aeromicrobium sp. YIM 150415]|uniref:GNAT family N-acetyltransferase n=1 Tax=Aeromicrobium sp. YIM 150415 TaxID=2803912 RepID=UPI0019632085|nr:GNAT family N-acetyltransferase [Aeromicrobium sp. YIM 150415]MBM9463938.1 GNAT family N-acetyltransferase [Aeromicrobium sp. YIM 150415]